MGKRKYEDVNDDSTKKGKLEEIVLKEEDENAEQPQNESSVTNKRGKNGGFDVKHFRKELSGKQGQTMVLTQFLQVCLNPDNEFDYLLEYLKSGGNSHEILRQINEENKKNLTLTTPAFHLFHLIILKVQSSLPHMITITEEACRYFLNNFMSTVEIMISENSGPRHRKIILKLLTSMVTLNADLGIEVLSHAPLTPKHLQYIVENTNYKEKDNVRTAFVHFMTSFLVDGHLPLIKALLEKQGLLALVIPGLVQDKAEAVLMLLNILKRNVIENTFISKSLKLKTFSHNFLHNMFKIFSWKGPPELSYDVRNELRPEIITLLSDIILTLFTSHRLGLYFVDNSLGTTDVNKNQNLYKAILSLKRPWENENVCETILQIVHKCPDLHRAVMNVVEQSFEPQHSPIWERTVTFVIKLLDKMKPESVVPRMNNLNAAQTANFVRFVTLPVPLLKFIQTNLGKDRTVSLYCIKVLVKMLQTLRRYMQILDMEDSPTRILELRNKLEYFVPKHLPAPAIIVTLIQELVFNKEEPEEKVQEYRLPKVDATNALIYLTDLLLLYNEVHPAFFEMLEGNIDMKQILNYSTTLTEGNIALLKFKIVSLWLTLDMSAISLKNPMFKDLFLIMLEVYTSDSDNTWIEAKSTLYSFLKNTAIFEADDDEIHLVLYSLRNSKINHISLIADIVEYVLINIHDLTAYIRDQIVHFEISNETSEACLAKLFDDLMENRSTEESVFLENKVPSTFIVGCMQYTQANKEAKKHLKHFLSIYISNLFHSNYSPELTEVLIGDSKLDVRGYVTNWVSQPVSLPESITAQDNTLRNLSKSVINQEELALTTIFPYLEEAVEDYDIICSGGASYKLNVLNNIDSSELLIWERYLIFCTVRLTNIGCLNEKQQEKITNYFNCLIAIGKKIHMIKECRVIMSSLLKNPHFLKIYKPLRSKDSDSCLLATTFLLDTITLHNDVIMYLDKKHRILKSYRQKNYNELIKAFIKISKRKNLDSSHTVKVLKIVGMTNDDDFLVINKIFGLDVSCCVNDDKEPSFVLDILQTLIEKYSTTIVLEAPQHIIRKSMKLYTELLTDKEMNPNLSSIECALTNYFKNKPHHSAYINDEIFKRFFNAVTIRKTTSQLASVLLKYNGKFCNIFKEQISRPEILSQRELTLPLGDAVINHKQFLIENKEFLNAVFEEYKSNINKVLEKPHKVGQVYNSCWQFIRKLVLECLDLQDCQKLFTKSHKFEVVEPSHFNLLQAVFLKICLHNECHKKDLFINYILSLLHITTIALKENKDTNVIHEIGSNLYNALCISKSIKEFQIKEKDDLKKVTEGAVWQNYCKAVLKDSLKVKTASQGTTIGPRLLFLLSELVKLLYPQDHEDVVTLFDMVTSHSEFLNVMLSHHSSDIKSRLIEFLYTLIQLNKSVMKSQQIPVYLSAYHATRSPCDRLILAILNYYESNGQPVNEYKPYVFGDSAANHYAVRKSRATSLWGHPTPNRVLNLFDREITERTIRNFPVTQKLEYHYELSPNIDRSESLRVVLNEMSKEGSLRMKVKDVEGAVNLLLVKAKYERVYGRNVEIGLSHSKDDEGCFDPVFVLPLLSHLLAPGSVVSCFKLLRAGVLSVPVMALSSRCELMRAAAYHVLHRFWLLLETETRHKNDKLFLTDFINTLRQSLSTAIIKNSNEEDAPKGVRNPRLPAIDALYLARALTVSTASSDPLYKPVNNFFIAKQIVDFTVVPDFLTLFHDSDVESTDRRLWILEVIKDGVKTMTDINVVFKTMCLKMIMDFYSSVLSDRKTKDRILGVLNSVISVPRAFDILLEGYGLMSWLHSVVRQLGKDDRALVKSILILIKNMIHSTMINAFAKHLSSSKTTDKFELKINKEVENAMSGILYDLIQFVDKLEQEDVGSYIRIFNLLSRRAIKCMTRKQILTLISKCGSSFKADETVQLLTKAVISNDGNILKSKCLNADCGLGSREVLLNELTVLTNTYIV